MPARDPRPAESRVSTWTLVTRTLIGIVVVTAVTVGGVVTVNLIGLQQSWAGASAVASRRNLVPVAATSALPADAATPSPRASDAVVPTASPTPTPSASASPAPTPSGSLSPSASAGPTPTASATASAPPAPTSTTVNPAWIDLVARSTDIPARAALAYGHAQLVMAIEQPACTIGWDTLAAIGKIESNHGRHSGAVLGPDGRSTPVVRGPVLSLADTDGGRLDGDPTRDRAVGPMQFLPSTWARWGSDGNGDGVADPDQIDDAALAAARYLCASGPLDTPAHWRTAVYSYNHLDSYVDKVAATANAYTAAVS